MIPWPIAILALLYGVVASCAALTSWKIAMGLLSRPLLIQLAWLALSTGATIGLLFLKPWGRLLALGTSLLLMVALFAVSSMLVFAARERGWGMLVALIAALQLLPIRYLRLPKVKALFRAGQVAEA